MRKPSRNSKTCTSWTWVGDRFAEEVLIRLVGESDIPKARENRMTCAHPKERSRFPPLAERRSYLSAQKVTILLSAAESFSTESTGLDRCRNRTIKGRPFGVACERSDHHLQTAAHQTFAGNGRFPICPLPAWGTLDCLPNPPRWQLRPSSQQDTPRDSPSSASLRLTLHRIWDP
jgi:hypothetical protein